jgi:hypothetical protein
MSLVGMLRRSGAQLSFLGKLLTRIVTRKVNLCRILLNAELEAIGLVALQRFYQFMKRAGVEPQPFSCLALTSSNHCEKEERVLCRVESKCAGGN